MVDSLRAARYPFVSDAAAFIEENGVEIDDLLSSPVYADARKRGMKRVMGALKNHEIEDVALNVSQDSAAYVHLIEILSYGYARMIVSDINDRFLTKRYALAEAERVNRILETDSESIDAVSSELGINEHRNPDGTVSIHFADYLRYSVVLSAVEWKLINRDVRNGYVLIPRKDFGRLVQNAFLRKLESEIPLPLTDDMRKKLSKNSQYVRLELANVKTSLSPTKGQGINNDCLPPCIKAIIKMAQAGQNLPHSARFALVSFLHAMGATYDEIISIFAESPDFDESKSRYQIMHITGELNGSEGYTPPGCGAMKTDGICFDPDELCEHVKHPLNYYRIKARDLSYVQKGQKTQTPKNKEDGKGKEGVSETKEKE
ncbi:MAG: DNA primase [Methanomethylophilus sp.]|jgi:DNA primase large subunit